MAKQYHTKGKDILFDYFVAHKGKRFCAKDIGDYIEINGLSMNQATIYRNLDKLTNEGVLLKSKNLDDDQSYYQYVGENSCCHEHLHLQCKKCGRIIHLEGEMLSRFYEYICCELDFALETKESVLVGLCADCKSE